MIFDYGYFSKMKIRKYFICILLIFLSVWNISDGAGQNKYALSLKKEIPILTAGIGFSSLGWYLMKNTEPLNQYQINELNCENINSIDRLVCSQWSPEMDKWSDLGLVTSVLLPVSLLFTSKGRDNFSQMRILYFETMLLTSAGVTISKGIFRRIRPMAYNINVPAELKERNIDLRHSFYSGHTAIAFSSVIFFATVYNKYYHRSKSRPYVWGGSLALASSVGMCRVLAGKHFPTDVIVGAVMGGLIGFIVPHLHEKKGGAVNSEQPFELKITFTF